MVLDASAVVELLLGSRRGEAVAAAVQEAGADSSLHAPDLLDVEVAQVFRRYVAHGLLSEARAAAAVSLLERLPVTRHPGRILLPRIWALRANLTAYDAAYISLAEALDAPLLTCDERLARSPGHGAVVVAVA
jgi:predicted nucleic acid-binding protein